MPLMKSRHRRPDKTTGSHSQKRKRWALIGIALLAVTAIYLFNRSGGNGPAINSGDKLYLVPAPPKIAMDRLDDPNADGWPTEALAEQAKEQIVHLLVQSTRWEPKHLDPPASPAGVGGRAAKIHSCFSSVNPDHQGWSKWIQVFLPVLKPRLSHGLALDKADDSLDKPGSPPASQSASLQPAS